MNKLEFAKLSKKEDMILAFNQLKDDYRQLFAINDDLQSKIDKVIELKHNWQSIKENATIVFDNNSLIEFMNNLEKILKEDK